MKRSRRCAKVGLVFSVLVVSASPVHADSSSNGVYGGYVGSDQWFNSMRQGAADRAMIESLGGHQGGRGKGKTPAGYLDYTVILRFPGGNPFPDRRIPDVRIVARNRKADPVLRSPYVDRGGSFHTSLKKGELYDVYWFYPFGSKEKFATIFAGPTGPLKRRIVLDYVPRSPSGRKSGTGSATPPEKAPSPGGRTWEPPKIRKWDAPQVGGGYRPPRSDNSYQPPQSDNGYRPPQSDNSYQPPRSGNDYRPPKSDGDYRPPEAGPGYREPGTR